MAQPPSISDLVAQAGSGLTPTERSIAEVVLREPTLLAFGTVSELAQRVGTSRPSIVRFAHKLGLDGYTVLQERARGEVARQLTRPSDRIRRAQASDDSVRATVEGALDSVFALVNSNQLAGLVSPLVEAGQVWILSGETSKAGAYAFQSGLSMVRPGVHLLEDRSPDADLSDVAPGDVAVVFDFFRYRRSVARATQVLADAGVRVLAITDSPLSPLVEWADVWCEIKVPAVGPFDSSIPVVAVAELLVSRVAKELRDEATRRVDRIEALWEKTEVFL
ncbi:MAG: MurR/RpiR family transcriptional regulator [Phycisphaerales bacterium JB063]